MSSDSTVGSAELDPVFQERIEILFHEIELAVKWDRPSILFAIYRSEHVRDQVNALLAEKLASLSQKTHRIKTDQFDFISGISELPDLKQTVLLIEGFTWECGREGLTVLTEFNKHRDFFLDNQIRAVFWLYEQEVTEFSETAAECWLMRQRVVDFVDLPARPEEVEQPMESLLQEVGESLPEMDLSDESFQQIVDLAKKEQADVSHANKLLSLGILGWQKGNPQASLKYLRTAAAIAKFLGNHTIQAQCQNAIAQANAELGNLKEAIAAYQIAASHAPDSSQLWNNLGSVLAKNEQNDEAIKAFNKAAELAPREVIAWDGLGNVYLKMGLHQNAISAFEKSLEISQENETSWTGIGQAWLETDQWEKASTALGKAVKLNPHAVAAWIGYARSYMQLEKEGEALDVYKKAVELNPGEARLWKELGGLYLKKQDYIESITAFQKAVSLCPRCPQVRIDLASAYFGIGDYEAAAKVYEEFIPAIDDKAMLPALLNQMGDTYMHLKEYEKAIGAYEKADKVKNVPVGKDNGKHESLPEVTDAVLDNEEEQEILIPTPERGGKMNEANQVFDLKTASEWNELGNTHLKAGALNDAIFAYTKAIEQSQGTSWPYIKNLAQVHYQKGKVKGRLTAGQPEAPDQTDDEPYDPHVEELFDADAIPNPERAHSRDPLPGGDEPVDALPEVEPDVNQVQESTCKVLDEKTGCQEKKITTGETEAKKTDQDASRETMAEGSPLPGLPASFSPLKDEPRNSIDWNEHGDSLARVKKYDEAIKAYKKAIELNPGFGLPYNNMGMVYYHLGRFETATLLFRKSVDLLETREDRVAAWNKLGDSYRRLGDYESALNAYQKSSEMGLNLKQVNIHNRQNLIGSAVVG